MFVMCVIRHTLTSNLIKYIRIHSGERHYTYEVSNKAVSQQSSLNIQQHMHSVDGADNRLVFSGSQ